MSDLEEPRTAKGEPEIEEPTRAERTIARRAAESRATVPELELRDEVEMTACAQLRTRNGASITAMLARACALALRDVPRANASYSDGRFELYPRVNIAVAVPTEDSEVLATLHDADRRSIEELDVQLSQLARAAAEGKLTHAQLSGATFTLWDMGRYGVASANAPVQPPQAAAIVAGAVREGAISRGGALEAGLTMTLTLVCDHRILHGAQAAAFLATVKERLEQPERL